MMKRTWGRLFRRRSTTETQLREDFPSDAESDITDDEQRRAEWRGRGSHRVSYDGSSGREHGQAGDWEYYSDYNVSFSSDNSVIDAYRERSGPYMRDDGDFEDVFRRATKEESNYEQRGRPDERSRYLAPPSAEPKHWVSSPVSGKSRAPPKSPNIRERVKALENSATGKRRGSLVPQGLIKYQEDEGARASTWSSVALKKKLRKHHKHRRRAQDISDDESKYTVNLSLDELNDIIKKNVSSVMKTIVTSKTNKLSPSGSFSTETETIFSGSSSHSTEVPTGILNKQIKAQLDKDQLRGNRRASLAPNMSTDMDNEGRAPGNILFHTNQGHSVPALTEIPSNSYSNTCQIQPSSYLNVMAPNMPPVPAQPPPPPPPPPLPTLQPQVTFSIPATGYPVVDSRSRPTTSSHIGYDQTQEQLTVTDMINQELMNNRFNTLGALSPGAINRLQARRHTLSTLGTENLLSGLTENFESKLEKVNNAIRLLDNNIALEESVNSNKSSSFRQSSKSKQTDTSSENSSSPEPIATSTGIPDNQCMPLYVFTIYAFVACMLYCTKKFC